MLVLCHTDTGRAAFDCNNNLDMEEFYSNLEKIIKWKIIKWNEMNSFHYWHEVLIEDDTFLKILSILSYVSKLWRESCISGNLDKVIISFIIAERLFLKPEEDFNWDFDDSKLKEKLEISIKSIKIEISDELPERAGYSDRKFNTDYKKAVATNDYKGIFIFFDELERGLGRHSVESEYIKNIIRITANVDISILSKLIGDFTPALIYLVIGSITNEQISNLLELYDEENQLPLLTGLRKIVTSTNISNHNHELSSNWDFIEKSSDIIQKIAKSCADESLYKHIRDSIRCGHCKFWHILFTAFIAKNEDYISDYSSNIKFGYEEFGEYSYDTFIHFRGNNALDCLSTQIFSNFIKYVDTMEYRQHPFIFSSFYKYFFHAVSVQSENSCTKYYSMIEEISIKLLRFLYSWNLRKHEVYFTKFIYWILSSKSLVEPCKMNLKQYKHTCRIFEDNRILNLLEVKQGETIVDFHELKLFIEDSDKINSIILPLKNKAIKLEWDKIEK